ncbi:MAG: GNAT family N-acetyltransferase [Anaerorhabdus sp.]
MIIFKFYKGKENYDDCFYVRNEVFVIEQGFSLEIEQDEIDNTCTHIVFYADNQPIATGRSFINDHGDYTLGRICVLPSYRGDGLGARVIQTLELKAKEEGASKTHLGAQIQAIDFYKRLGYKEVGEVYYEEGCPHIHMIKSI